jgi:predicted dehydrogenase
MLFIMNELTVGLVGAGGVAYEKHAPSWERDNRVELSAIYEPDPSRRQNLAHEYNITEQYDEFEKIIDSDIDIIDICSPPRFHFEQASKSIKKGKHVLMEKPMWHTNREARQIRKLQKQHNVEFSVIHNNIFRPNIRNTISKKDELGSIHRFEYKEFVGESNDYDNMAYNPDHWSHRLEGGRWMEALPHPVYVADQFIDNLEVKSVTAVKTDSTRPWLEVDEINITLTHDNGIATLQYSTNNDYRRHLELNIFGSKRKFSPIGNLKDDEEMTTQPERYIDETKEFIRAVINKILRVAGFVENSNSDNITSGHETQINKFVSSIIGNEDPPVSWGEIYRTNNIVTSSADTIHNKLK